MAGLNFDVTEQRQLQEALRASAHDITARLQQEQQSALLLEVARMLLTEHAQHHQLPDQVFALIKQHLNVDVMFFFRVHTQNLQSQGLPAMQLVSCAAPPHILHQCEHNLAVGDVICAQVAASSQPLLLDARAMAAHPVGAGLHALGLQSYACHPLLDGQGQVMGTFTLASTLRDAFDSSHLRFMQTICSLLALAWERQRTSAQLRRNYATFDQLIVNNPFGLYMVDADFRLAQVSQGALKAFASIAPLLGRDFAEIVRTVWPDPLASEVIGHFKHILQTGKPYVCYEAVERRADLEVTQAYDWRIERIELPDGRFGVVCYFYDLSERQRWTDQLQARERELKSLADNTPDVLSRFDRDLRHVFVNAAITQATGKRPEEIIGKTNRELEMPGPLCDAWEAAVQKYLLPGNPPRWSLPGARAHATTPRA